MSGSRRTSPKSLKEIAAEWDRIADIRAEQIDLSLDLSMQYVLLPAVERLSVDSDRDSVLDLGCGVGHQLSRLALAFSRVVAIDVSGRNIAIAQSRTSRFKNIQFVHSSVEEFSQSPHERGRYSVAVANMTLMTTPNLGGFIDATALLLRAGGMFVFTITHPWFWPNYWNYDSKSWFRYGDELFIEAPFRISLDDHQELTTTHIHRPLSRYMEELHESKFTVDEILEPLPDSDTMHLYPRAWKYPRYLAVRCTSQRTVQEATSLK